MKILFTRSFQKLRRPSMRKASLLLAFICFSFASRAQLIVDDNKTAMQLVSKFVGSNVTIIGIPSLGCTPTHNGYFDGVATNLGLNAGIIMSTGIVETQGPFTIGANITNGQSAVNNQVSQDVAYGTVVGHPTLNALINNSNTFNNCVLEFDFTADIDTTSDLNFQYVFASDEYETFNCSGFNDVFGFIISGPGIVGAPNIAVVPGTNIPVMINSINSGYNTNTNCTSLGVGSPFTQYYVDNNNGTTVAFNGFTTILTATAQIQPCDTYHMFLGIQNTGDDGYQSAVFLKENSFSVDTTAVDLAGLVESQGGYIVEGCTPLEITFSHDTALHRRKKICLHYSGSALMNADYGFLADTLIIAPNQVSNSFFVNAIPDGLTETINTFDPVTGYLTGTVTDTLKIYEINCCTKDTLAPRDSIIIPIRDSLWMNLLSRDTFYCEGTTDSTVLHVTGDDLYSYAWTPTIGVEDPADTLTKALPVITTNYTVTASYPGCPTVSRDFTIFIEPNPLVEIDVEDTSLCVVKPVTLNATVFPVGSPYNYSWAPVDGNIDFPNNLSPDFFTLVPGVYNYTLSVTTPHGCLGTDSIRIEAFPGISTDIVIEDTVVCTNDQLLIEVDVTPPSMEATSSFQWVPSTHLSGDQIPEPTYHNTVDENNTFIYTLFAVNSYGCRDTDMITIRSLKLPDINMMNDTALCLYEPTQIFMDVLPADAQYIYTWTPAADLSDATVREPFFFNSFNTDHAYYTLYVEVKEAVYGCTSYDSLHIHTYPHVFLTTIPDQLIKYNESITLSADGAAHYVWTPSMYLDDPNIKAPVAHAVEPIVYTVYGVNEWGCRDTGSVKVDVDYSMDEFIPSVFSPNGDGKNDVFRMLNMKYQKLIEFRVFNRWGKEIYNNINANAGWDGTFNGENQDPGIYHYLIRVNTPEGGQKMYKGEVTLIR